MIRRRIARPATTISLFPFLAVLVCTMGALIVLLVLVVHQARVHADTVATQDDSVKQRRIEQEDYQWRQDLLEQQRKELTAQMSDKRLELSHLEDHIRRLQQLAKQLAGQAQQMTSNASVSADELQQMNHRADQLRQAVAAAQQQLDQAKAAAANTPPSYAIVPYRGTRGTHRRPIYIECLADRLVIHPGGVELTREDMEGPQGPGNPLDAVLRAIREHWASGASGDPAGEPYPLLIVRPQGTKLYGAARNALGNWDDEFGYELVGADMIIEFPPPDPTLTDQLSDVIRIARQRQSLLLAAMPSQFRQGRSLGLVASGNGGFVIQHSDGSESEPSIGLGHRHGGDGQGTDQRFEQGLAGRAEDAADGQDDPRQAPTPESAPRSQSGDQANAGQGPVGGAPVAEQRGSNWALPHSSPSAIAVTRPIGLVCSPDRLTLLPDPGTYAQATVIPFGDSTAATVDQLVAAVQARMQRWGIAISGGYWKPIVKVEIIPGAEQRFREMELLLKDSGIEFERRTL